MKKQLTAAFTLLELLLVIAILASLTALVVFSLRPVEIFNDTNESKIETDIENIEKGLNAYISEEFNVPVEISSLTTNYYDICRYGEDNCTSRSINLDFLVDNGQLSEIPVNPNCVSSTDTCYDLNYDSAYNSYEIIISDILNPIALNPTYSASSLPVINGLNNGDNLGQVLNGIGDINNDGFDDIAISAITNDTNFTDSGAVYIFFGRTNQLSTSDTSDADITILGNYNGGRFGHAVAGIGDFNGDSIDDFVITATGVAVPDTNQGQVYIFYGQSSFSSTIQSNQANIILTGNDWGDSIGSSIAGLGDMDKDGFDDILVGAAQDEHSSRPQLSGRNYFIKGGSGYGDNYAADIDSSVSTAMFNGINYNDFSGLVANIGDINNDNYNDFAIAAQTASDTGTFRGRVYIYYGKNNFSGDYFVEDADIIINGTADGQQFGTSVSAAGDFNGDGIDDLIVGTHAYSGVSNYQGRAFIFFGNSSVLPAVMDSTDANVMIDGEITNGQFGRHVSNAGDVNMDGIDDVFVSAAFTSYGRAYLVYGNDSAYDTDVVINASSSNAIFNGTSSTTLFSNGIGNIGDYNGDGYLDLLMGASHSNVGGSNRGQAFLYLSDPE